MRKAMLAAALFCGACGGSSGPASVNGNIGGESMGAQDAVSNVTTQGADSQGFIFITNAPATCSKLQANQQPKNAKALGIGVANVTASNFSAPTGTGTFTVYPSSSVGLGNAAVVEYVATNATCQPIADIEATSGTVTLTRVDNNGYAGSFDITFSDGSHVTGNFTASRCAALSDTISGACT